MIESQQDWDERSRRNIEQWKAELVGAMRRGDFFTADMICGWIINTLALIRD